MAFSPRDLATRLGIDQLALPQAVYRGVASAGYFRRGYRYGRHIAPSDASIPSVRPGPPSPLESYVETHTAGPDIFKWSHYFDIYDRHLSRFRGQEVHVVEIGVAGGGSLDLWRDYLGPAARICGIDIDPQCKRFEADGIEVVIGDQSDRSFWRGFLESHDRIDAVIDDGGHFPHQQVVTLESLLPHMRPGGVYICEDIHGPFQPFHAFVDGLTRPLSSIGFAHESNPANALQRQVASVHRYPILTVIEKAVWSPLAFTSIHRGTEWSEALAPTLPAS